MDNEKGRWYQVPPPYKGVEFRIRKIGILEAGFLAHLTEKTSEKAWFIFLNCLEDWRGIETEGNVELSRKNQFQAIFQDHELRNFVILIALLKRDEILN